MWRYIVESNSGGYIFGNNDPSKPLVFVKRADAHQIAKSWAKSEERDFHVVRISTKSAMFRSLAG